MISKSVGVIKLKEQFWRCSFFLLDGSNIEIKIFDHDFFVILVVILCWMIFIDEEKTPQNHDLKKVPLWYLQNSLPRSSKSTILILIKSPLIFWKNPTEILKKYPQIRSQNPYFNIEPLIYTQDHDLDFSLTLFSKNPFKTYISLQYYSNSL